MEVTSIGQMNNILKYGCYFIGSSAVSVCHNLHEVIHLSLKEQSKKLVKKNYNLEELRDLESKLVLITGSKADHRKKVDFFLDVSFCVKYLYILPKHQCRVVHK